MSNENHRLHFIWPVSIREMDLEMDKDSPNFDRKFLDMHFHPDSQGLTSLESDLLPVRMDHPQSQ